MTRRFTAHCGFVALVSVLTSAPGNAQRLTIPAAELGSDSAAVRARAFYGLVSAVAIGQPPRPEWTGPRTDLLAARAKQQDDLAVTLIALLEHEDAIIELSARQHTKLPADFDGEGYWIDLVYTVVQMHDARGLHALIPAIANGGWVRGAVASFGEAAVPHVVRALDDPEWMTRLGAVLTLDTLVARRNEVPLTDGAMLRIRTALLQTLHSATDPILRTRAIAALEPFDGADISAIMERIAASEKTKPRSRPHSALNVDPAVAARLWLSRHPPGRPEVPRRMR